MAVNEAMVKDDLYDAVNAHWAKTATIPKDKSTTGGFTDLVTGVDRILMRDLYKMSTKKLKIPDVRMAQAVTLYKVAKNIYPRTRLKGKSLKRMMAAVDEIKSYEDYQKQWTRWILIGLPSPVDFDIDADMKNAKVNALFAGAPGLILPDKTYYAKDNQQGPQLMKLWTAMVEKLFTMLDYSDDDAKKVTEQAKQFDALLVPHVKSAEEAADYSKMYNPQSLDEFAGHTDQLDLAQTIQHLVGAKPDKVIVTEPKYMEALNDILTNHFDLFKSWLMVGVVREFASDMGDDMREVNSRFSRALSGQQKVSSPQKFAYHLTCAYFPAVIGDYYARKYFGPDARADVQKMVHRMVNVYKRRLSNNQWLGEATRQKAITKLDKLGIQVGYPDKLPQIADKMRTHRLESLMANVIELNMTLNRDRFSKWNKPVDRMRWEMSPATVNAYYHPFKNIIVFPAAILQAPFYSLKQSSSQNYGGIGAVIAHEISHAFDNNGALFDEYGNLNNWWTDQDRAHFKKLSQQMIDEFNGLPFAGQKVNGKLTVSENIADDGGLSCALEAAKQEDDVDLKAFFLNWGRIWRMKATTQYMQLLLSIDVHAPNKLRANVQAQNMDEFYETFQVKEGDGMYKAPADRVRIW